MDERYRLPLLRGGRPARNVGRRDRRPWAIAGRSRHDGVVSETEIGGGLDGDLDGDGDGDVEATASGPVRPRVDKTMVFMLVLLGIGALLVVRGLLVGITGDERADLPVYIESVDPVPEAVQVPNQSSVFVDLIPGYTGVFVIDDIELETTNIDDLARVNVEPGQQIELPPVTIFEPGNATLTFTPGAAAPITEFVDGEHTVVVIYWRVEDGRQRARTFTWTFNVV
jgi:hypothetical protein